MSVRIVLADDQKVIRHLLKELLEAEEGWEVCAEAENGQEAVQLCAELRPEIVVLDLSMPIMGGLEAAREIRILAPETGVLIVSVHDNAAMVSAAIDAGARAYIRKDEARNHLVRAIRALLVPDGTYFPLQSTTC